MSIVSTPFVSLILISSQFLILVIKHMAKTTGVVVGGLGQQKLVFLSYAQMLICSLLFICEHLFTFKFSALMPKLSKENLAPDFKSSTVIQKYTLIL